MTGAKLSAGWMVSQWPLTGLAGDTRQYEPLVVLYTNDWHSRIDPFPMDGGRYEGMGGAARRAAMIRKIREKYRHVVLLDSGDIFQGTPYFNVFGGEIEFRTMTAMGYDAATMGNHDFDNGLTGFRDKMKFAGFPFLTANYDFKDTELEGQTKNWQVLERGPYRIGVFGLGIELKGLVPEHLYGKTRYLDPVETANKTAGYLKDKEKCNVIICLSHLGYSYSSEKISDLRLAENTRNIDMILGGHTHTFLHQPVSVNNLNRTSTWVSQTGWAGMHLGMALFSMNKGETAANPDFSMLKIC